MKTTAIKPLSEKSTEILKTIFDLAEGNGGSKKIDNSPGDYIPLCVEILYRDENGAHLSICHYLEQNGDLMTDPEMCFYYSDFQFFPYYWRNDFGGIEETSLKIENRISGINRKKYNEHLEFSEMWMENLKYQQNL